MPGGDREPYDESVKPIFEAIAADVDGTPCCTYVGPDGAGHYVKMVHNGIEYADMQLIAESYDLLRNGVGLEVPEIAERFQGWNESELESFLIEISARVLAKTDDATGQPLVDVILDAAEQKGTGRWTAQNALELGVPLTGITEAVFARTLSALKSEREAARRACSPARARTARATRRARWPTICEHALYASKIVSYAQGFAQMAAAADDEGWDIDLGAMATIWRGGCIIRARFLDRIREAYDDEPELANLMLADFFAQALADAQDPWRRVVGRGGRAGHPDAGVLVLTGLLRRLPPRARAGQPDPGAARPVRRPHLPAGRPRGHVPHHVGRGRTARSRPRPSRGADRPQGDLARDPARAGERHARHRRRLDRQRHEVLGLEVVHVRLAAGAGQRLRLERQRAQVVGQPPAALDRDRGAPPAPGPGSRSRPGRSPACQSS